MFALLLIQFNRLSIRTRLMGGLSVVLIIAAISSVMIFKNCYYDHLSRYGSNRTLIYFHLNLQQKSANAYQDKLVTNLLANFPLIDLNRDWLNSELVWLCDNVNNQSACGLIIRTKNPTEIRNYFSARQIKFRQLSDNEFFVTNRLDWLSQIKLSYNPWTIARYHSVLNADRELTLVINETSQNNDLISKAISLSLNHSFKLQGQTAAENIRLTPSGLANILPLDHETQSVTTTCDILIQTQQASITEALIASLLGFSSQPSNLTESNIKPTSLYLCLKQNSATGDFLTDYDFMWKLEAHAVDSQTLEQGLLAFASHARPNAKTKYLTDGTKVLLLRPDTTVDFVASGTSHVLILSDGQAITYDLDNNNLSITDNPAFLDQSTSQAGADFIKINLSQVTTNPFKTILSDLSTLEVNNDEIIIN